LTPIRILRSAPFGKNFDVVLNREPVKTKIQNENLGNKFFYTTSEDRIRIYPKETTKDSIPFQINIIDSVGFEKDTLIWAKFPTSERKPDKVEISVNSGKSFYQNLDIELKFNKPILSINPDSLFISYDSASRIPIQTSMLSFGDSTSRNLLNINLSIPDSLAKEIFTLNASDSTFQDIEGQFNEKPLSANYRKLERKNLADGVSGDIIGAKPPFIIQLTNEKNDLIRELFLENSNRFEFALLEPGTFKIRVIEDLNGNKRWDPSNFVQKKSAERIFYFFNEELEQALIVRSGWTLEEQNILATPPTGLSKSTQITVNK
jgi:hypothetical protein